MKGADPRLTCQQRSSRDVCDHDFPAPAELEVAVLEQFTSHVYLESADDTAHYNSAFDYIRAAALSPLDSEALILHIAEDLTRT